MSSKERSMIRPTVSLPEETNEAIEERLSYGDSKSGWIREAIRQRLERENDDATDE